MKNKALAIILILIVALSAATWAIYNQISNLQSHINELQAQNNELKAQNNELQEQNNELQGQNIAMQYQISELQEQQIQNPIRITAVNYIGGFSPYIGLTIASDVNVTVLNNHTYPVNGLTLTTRFLESTGEESGGPTTYNIDGLQAGESREIKAIVLWTLDSDHSILNITLKSGDIILDEWTKAVG
jgi:FtsZ-binding cell division protein ZapB